jgi:hypothetical protein
VSFSLLISSALPAHCEIDSQLDDEYLESQFDWAMYLEAREVKYYLNYEGSKLKPLTRVNVYFRAFPDANDQPGDKHPSKAYEDLWYHKGVLIGLRRKNELDIEHKKIGILIVGKPPAGTQFDAVLCNAVVRLVLDLQFRHIVVSVVQVPILDYDQFTGNLASLKFYPNSEPHEGKQLSLHIRSYPQGREDYYYLH